ncbi:MAG: GerAB/ArcD/ProY family transporter [Lawsonibacter sp.]|jgi:spore germination protein KB
MRLEPDRISHTQLTALVWAGVLAPAAELLPSLTLPVAGRGAWLAPAAAIPLVLLSGWMLGRLSGALGLAQSLLDGFGRIAGGGILFIYMVWGELLLALRLRLCAQRLLASGYRDGTLWFFLGSVCALALWMGLGKLPAFARAGQFFLAILLAAGGIVLALSMFQVKIQRVLPLWSQDVVPVLRCSLPAAGVLGWGLYAAFLTGQVHPLQSKGRWYGRFWGVGGCLLLCFAQWIILGNLGPELARRLDNPFFALAKSVGVDGAFQRVESVIAALWTLADLSMAVLLLFALRAGGQALWPNRKQTKGVIAAVVGAAVLAGILLQEGNSWVVSRNLVPVGNLILGLGVPSLLMILRGLCGKRPTGGTSCGENGAENHRSCCLKKQEKKQ